MHMHTNKKLKHCFSLTNAWLFPPICFRYQLLKSIQPLIKKLLSDMYFFKSWSGEYFCCNLKKLWHKLSRLNVRSIFFTSYCNEIFFFIWKISSDQFLKTKEQCWFSRVNKCWFSRRNKCWILCAWLQLWW